MAVETDAILRELLGMKHIAVVGCSSTPGKDAHEIPRYLRDHGYDVIPVNPNAVEIFERQVYDDLITVAEDVELVNVFRPSDELDGIVEMAIERGDVKAIWAQLGISDDEAAERAARAGVTMVQDRCMKVEHQRLVS